MRGGASKRQLDGDGGGRGSRLPFRGNQRTMVLAGLGLVRTPPPPTYLHLRFPTPASDTSNVCLVGENTTCSVQALQGSEGLQCDRPWSCMATITPPSLPHPSENELISAKNKNRVVSSLTHFLRQPVVLRHLREAVVAPSCVVSGYEGPGHRRHERHRANSGRCNPEP